MGRPPTLPDVLPRACALCGMVFTPPARKWAARKFCSAICGGRAQWRNGLARAATPEAIEKMSATKRRQRPTRGYTKIHGRHAHRIVAEQMLGRELLPGEIVHHKDGNKSNNDPSNLEVMSQSDHCKEHDFGHNPKARRGSLRGTSITRN